MLRMRFSLRLSNIFFSDAIFVCAFKIICAVSFLSNFNSHIALNYLQMISIIEQDNSSDGRVVRASASRVVDLGLIPSWVKPMTLKLVFTASLLDAQHYKKSAKNKPASSLVVLLGEALSGISPSWCGRQVVSNS